MKVMSMLRGVKTLKEAGEPEVKEVVDATAPVILSGSSGRNLAENIAWALGSYVYPLQVGRFADGEVEVEIGASLRNRKVFIVETCAAPVHDSIMEIMLLVDACRRASAAEITVVAPYLAYSRQDRKARPRSPISAKVVADMLEGVGVDRLMTFDLHSGQVQGFYNIPCDNLPGASVLAPEVGKMLMGDDICIVSTDLTGLPRAKAFARRLEQDVDIAVVDKRRAKGSTVAETAVLGDVNGRHCILIDDMIDTATTLVAAADVLRGAGASAISMVATHGLFSGDAVRRVAGMGLQNLWVTDTLPQKEEISGLRGVKIVSVASLLAECIRRVCYGDSLQEVYDAKF
jgi:ribose-phosphate pyrophosphokinase